MKRYKITITYRAHNRHVARIFTAYHDGTLDTASQFLVLQLRSFQHHNEIKGYSVSEVTA